MAAQASGRTDGQTFGPYRLDGLLGSGGMGEVHRAYHVEQDRTVALKLLHADLGDDEEYRRRFLRESRVTARLTDPHVIPIHSWGEIDGRLYLDMRLVEGEDLADVVARTGRLAPLRAVTIVGQVARALDAAHRSGLLHRDVKPSNVLLAADAGGDGDFAYLVDFGIARSLTNDTTGAGITRAGTAVGTLDYMAPERFLEQPVDARADVYALACVLHECLTGEKPFPVQGLPSLMRAHLRTPPPRPSAHRIAAPVELDEVVARGMAKDPAQRYPSAGALAAAARKALEGPATVPGSGPAAAPDVAPIRPARGVAPEPVARAVAPDEPTIAPRAPAPPPDAGPAHRPAVDRAGPRGRAAGLPPPVPATPRQRAATTRVPIPPPGHPLVGHPQPVPPAVPPARRRGRGLLVAAAVVVVAAVVAGAVYLLGPLDPPPQPGGGPTEAQRALLAVLPVGYGSTDCVPAPEREGAAVDAAVTCAGGPADGPSSAVFLHYRDLGALTDAHEAEVTARGLPVGDISTCRDGTATSGEWVRGTTGGLLLCRDDATAGAVIEWTETRLLTRAVVSRTDGDSAVLYDWWSAGGFL
ncbi:serine/threonine protein kinase [Pseudonocardia sp.]|uniref:serine/threonine-protein kinase n=1 Tax=Pseudonocardia sp. TaxID=60912 RepID=UPI002609EF78|nr:serine/threonine protein kinase [Pseudonocardia sp.]